jgi:hypothetical protein
MSDPSRPLRRRPRPRPPFRPEFTLLLLYFFAFFVFFALLLALPALLDGLHTLPPAPTLAEERAAGARIAQQAVADRLGWAFGAAVLALGAATWARVLPGLRRLR